MLNIRWCSSITLFSGNPDDPMLNPDMAYPFTNKMTIDERIRNILYTTWTRIYYKHWHLPRAQKIVDKWTAKETSVQEMDRNFSLVILGNNHVFGYPKPLLPNVIEVHGLQITEERVALPIVRFPETSNRTGQRPAIFAGVKFG